MQKVLISVFVTIAISVTTAYGQQNDQQLLGTWTFDIDGSLVIMDGASQARYNRLKPNTKIRVDQNYRNRQVTFFSDGSYQMQTSAGVMITASWQLVGNTLEIISGNNKKLEYALQWPQQGGLLLQHILGSSKTKPIFPKQLYYKN